MAGLLDNFNFDDPATIGLLSAGLNMLANSGRGGNMNTAQIIGSGLGSGLQGMQSVKEARRLAELQQQKQEHDALVMQAMRMENAQKQQGLDLQNRLKEFQNNYNSQQQNPQAQSMQQMGGNLSPTNDNADLLSKYKSQIQTQANDPYEQRMNLSAAYRKAGFQPQAEAEELSALKFRPEFDQTPRVGVGADNKPFTYVMDKQGNKKVIEGVLPREEMKLANLGGKDIAYNPFGLTPGQEFTRTQTPDSIASNATSMRGQNITDARAKELNQITRQGQQTQVINDPVRGVMLVDKGTGKVTSGIGANGQPIQSEAAAKKEYSANSVQPIISDAKEFIKNATGSYGGMAFDKAAQFFGGATGGAEAIAKLKVLEGQLMMSQPRMEGPQSDKDVAMYRQMAGQIGDPTVPASIKAAALDQIEKLNLRYSTGNDKKPQQQKKTGSWGIERVN